MSQAQARPELAGVKVKKRKKDLKSKYEPADFAEALIEEIKETDGNVDQVYKKLDSIADTLDFKRYVEPLFDVLFTGGILDIGGSHEEASELSPFSIFSCEDNPQAIKKHVEVFNHLIRRYRYLQRGFEDAMTKMLRLLNRFTPSESNKLAMSFSYFFIAQMAPMALLSVLCLDHLVKEGHALQFITVIFKTYLSEQSVDHLTTTLKKNALDDRLLDFFPTNKRTDEFLGRHFTAEGLTDIVGLFEKKNLSKLKSEFNETVIRMIADQAPFQEIVAYVKQSKSTLPENDLIALVWDAVMGSIDWSRRVEQCEEQAIKATKEYGKLFLTVVSGAKSELTLMLALQAFCYDDSRFTKTFSKFVTLFYKMDIISEAAVTYWYQKGASPKGKAVFVQQLQPFIKWLSEAEEESEDEK